MISEVVTIWKRLKEFIKTHEKTLKNLTKNSVLPFTSDEVVTNLSSVSLNADQLNVLNYGLTHLICPPSINKTDIFACFELISQRMLKNLKESKDTGKLATELSHLAHTYVSSYRLTASDLKKHRILKELRKNKNIVILRPDKGNGVVILDRVEYDKGLFKIINDTTKIRVLTSLHPTLLLPGKENYGAISESLGKEVTLILKSMRPFIQVDPSLLGSMVSLRCTNHERQIPPPPPPISAHSFLHGHLQLQLGQISK